MAFKVVSVVVVLKEKNLLVMEALKLLVVVEVSNWMRKGIDLGFVVENIQGIVDSSGIDNGAEYSPIGFGLVVLGMMFSPFVPNQVVGIGLDRG